MNENQVRALVFSTIAPVWIALHEKGLIPMQEMALFYEDAVARRRFELGETEQQTALAQELAAAIHKLAAVVQELERAARGPSDAPPRA